MSIEGDLRSVALAKVLQSIAARGSSGILTVQGEDDIVAVSFLDGGIVAADALNQTVEEGLGEVLQSRGLISAEDFSAAAREHQGGSAGSLGDLLVTRGLVERADLLASLRAQTFRLMVQILCWRQGEFKFYDGDEVSYEEGFRPLLVEELLLRSIEEVGERCGLKGPVPRLDAVYRTVPPHNLVQVYGRDGEGTTGGIWISPKQAELLTRMDGQTSAAVLAQQLGLGQFQATFGVYNLLQHDLIEYRGEARATGTVPVPAPALRVEEPAVLDEPASLRVEIFTPPEPGARAPAAAPSPYEVPGYDVEPAAPSVVQRTVGPALAALLVLAMVFLLGRRPGTFLLPFPWQENQRATVERQLRHSLFLKIDRAAKAYFLVNAYFPDTLDELVEIGLLSPADLRDPAGYRLAYSTDEVGYQIELYDGGQLVEGLGTSEAITGDFLLDPQWLRSASSDKPPLVLLD